MKVFHSKSWDFVGLSPLGFLFERKGEQFEQVIVRTACLDLTTTRVYFDWDSLHPRVRIPKKFFDESLLDLFDTNQFRVAYSEDSVLMFA